MLRLLILLFGLLAAPLVHSMEPPANAVASAHPLATQAGMRILDGGGNAFDAAVAVSAALAVVEPYSSGIGGGGFWLLHDAKSGRDIMIDGRERAPLAAHRDMYLDEEGNVASGVSVNGPLAAGIPGEPAALAHLAKHYGRLSLRQSLAPAIRYAREGFRVTPHYQQMAGFRRDVLLRHGAGNVFLRNGNIPALGERIVQPELARTLEQLAEHGHDGFYKGDVALNLVGDVRSAGGIWSEEDLAQYQVIEREPIRFDYGDAEVVAVPPPSSGGVALATMLQMIDRDAYRRADKTTQTHLLIEAMRRAYRDRAEFLGDSDFVDVPVERLTSREYANRLFADIDKRAATPSSELGSYTDGTAGNHTTHFSILDKAGNYVAATLSINYPFGSGFLSRSTGVLLNDEMDDFSAKPGSANVYGLVGAEANAIAPGKRMLSSMSPTFVRNGDRVAVVGTPGGSRIITMVMQGILEVMAETLPDEWVSRARIHHQYLPDKVYVEADALAPMTIDALEKMGHVIEESDRTWGNMQAVLWSLKTNRVWAASDPRGEGAVAVR